MADTSEKAELTLGDITQWGGEAVASGHMVFPPGSMGRKWFPQGMDIRISQGMLLMGGGAAILAFWAIIRELWEAPAKGA